MQLYASEYASYALFGHAAARRDGARFGMWQWAGHGLSLKPGLDCDWNRPFGTSPCRGKARRPHIRPESLLCAGGPRQLPHSNL